MNQPTIDIIVCCSVCKRKRKEGIASARVINKIRSFKILPFLSRIELEKITKHVKIRKK